MVGYLTRMIEHVSRTRGDSGQRLPPVNDRYGDLVSPGRGAGKEFIVHPLQSYGPRKDDPLSLVTCTAISRGLFREHDWRYVIIAFTSLMFYLASVASGGIVNGDFATGDLSGWTASALDALGIPTTPAISVRSDGANNFARFDTGTFAAGPFISTLEQSYVVDSEKPFLNFDFVDASSFPDATGTGNSPFADGYFASVHDGTNNHVLFLADQSGVLLDPFGQATGEVVLGEPLDLSLDVTVSANLGSFVGQNVTLFLDIVNEDDGRQLQFDLYAVNESEEPVAGQPIVPEPSSFALAIISLMILIATRRRGRDGRVPGTTV